MKVGIVGTGFSAAAHADALRRLPGVEVAAIVGRTRERAVDVAAQLGIPRALDSVDELLADDEIRVVHNCTPNDLHAEINIAALEAGRHVLAEKPLGRTAAEARVQEAAAASADAIAGVCFNYRHFPLVQQLRATVQSRQHGAVHLVHGGYLQDWLLYARDWSWRLDSERNGASRAVADIGSHWFDLVQHVLGEPIVGLCASLGTLHGERLRPLGDGATSFAAAGGSVEPYAVDSEDFAAILVRFAGGAQGCVTISQVSAGRKNRLHVELDAADAALAWDQEEANRLWVGRRDVANEVLVRDPTLLSDGASGLARLPAGHTEGWADALLNLVADFYASVDAHAAGRERHQTFASFGEAAQLCEVVDAVLESDATDRWIAVGRRAVEQVDA